jgi:hypothetical protein
MEILLGVAYRSTLYLSPVHAEQMLTGTPSANLSLKKYASLA